MPRPRKCRRIAFMPGVNYFKPAGIPMRFLQEVQLTLEEAEAIRLKDIEGLDQAGCAERMNISRPTAQRIIESARRKIADALLNGKAIRIEGGTIELGQVRYTCENGHQWDMPFDKTGTEAPPSCPVCNSANVWILPEGGLDWRSGRGRCRRRGFNR